MNYFNKMLYINIQHIPQHVVSIRNRGANNCLALPLLNSDLSTRPLVHKYTETDRSSRKNSSCQVSNINVIRVITTEEISIHFRDVTRYSKNEAANECRVAAFKTGLYEGSK